MTIYCNAIVGSPHLIERLIISMFRNQIIRLSDYQIISMLRNQIDLASLLWVVVRALGAVEVLGKGLQV